MPDNVEQQKIRVLVLGDIIGKSGCRALFSMVKTLKKEFKADLTIANGENADDGSGMTRNIVNDFFSAGIDIITTGNHIWRNKEIFTVLESEKRLLRPENYPKGVVGSGSHTIECNGHPVSILNLEGNLNRSRLRCPFQVGREISIKLKRSGPVIIVDFHAENPQEKEALAHFLDGEVSVLFGTHTHVQTADERIMPKGTGYITDIGMTGPLESVIGMSTKIAIDRALTQLPLKLEVEEKPAIIMGICVEIDASNGRTLSIERFQKKSLV